MNKRDLTREGWDLNHEKTLEFNDGNCLHMFTLG